MKKDKIDRRNFLTSLLRFGALGGTVGLAGYLATKRIKKRLDNQNCTGDSICDQCTIIHTCGLPRALTYKNSKRSD